MGFFDMAAMMIGGCIGIIIFHVIVMIFSALLEPVKTEQPDNEDRSG